jgi:hypothetical protein
MNNRLMTPEYPARDQFIARLASEEGLHRQKPLANGGNKR